MLVLRSVECNKDDKCVLTVVVTGVCTAPCSEDNERAGVVVMRVSRPRCSSHDTQHMPGQGGAYEHWNAIPRFQLNWREIIQLNCLSLFLWSHLIR